MKTLIVLLSILFCNLHPAIANPQVLPDYVTVTLRNVKSSKYMEVSGNPILNEKYKDSAALQQWEASISRGETDRWQKWHLIYRVTANGIRYYHIRNLHSGKLMDANGTIVQQLAALPQAADRQLWRLEDKGNGQYWIFNKGSGLALSLAGGTTGNGVKVILDRTANDGRQSWMLNIIANDTYRDDALVRFFYRNNTTQGSAAFDQGNSIPLTWEANNGKVLWVTQDAWDGVQLQPNKMFNCGDFHRYSNSVLIQPAGADWDPEHSPNMTINNSTSGKPRQVFNIQPGTSWSWAGPGIEIGDKVYVHCGEGQGLDITGQSLYRLTQSSGTEWKAERTVPNGLDSQQVITYSCGMVKPGDGYVYVFGKEGISFNYASYVHVARFRESNPLQWEYYNGSVWTGSPSPGSAAKIAEGRGTVSIAYLNGKYILMTMDQGFDCDTARNIYIATASSPTGPFSGQTLVYTIQEYFKGKYARYYTPVVHPEFDNGRNELLLTYCLNFSACKLESCEDGYMDPYYYRVKGIRIPYAKIGL
ncbi:RICIN domain-containing protein [Chitinophaga ginsengisoli]|nr:RICIN domain-containing protein [Chitinophaga ginsengisoli]